MKKIFLILTAAFGLQMMATAQSVSGRNDEDELNAITTAVPFLLISPDSRSGAMGDAGVAVSSDANAQHWNPSKLAFSDDQMQISLSYSPWLRKLVDDMNLAYLSWFMKLNKTSAVGASLRYFTLGDITFTDNNGQVIRPFRPAEFALDVSYSLQLSNRFSGGITARWINSNLTGGVGVSGADSKAANAFAVDIAGYYKNDDISFGDKDGELAFGMVISNIGNKISYTNTSQRDFLPANLRLGTALTIDLDQYNSISFVYDANKLLVPTPPIYDQTNPTQIIAGRDPDVGVAAGMFGSFNDAPGTPVYDEQGNSEVIDGQLTVKKGSVLREELREINHSVGMEYWYADQFAVRGGYFYEHPTKGNRQYFTIGAGFRYNVFGLDLSYLIATRQQNPLANTLRFTLSMRFDKGNSKVQAAN
ncbi:type IX secretion system outer membrane channel protein PorV [Cryomorpha ignava]|uniref:Type IX secretion system outer membrane channel protein PorV n=1 Tax=Cryomorpha ignava TaxID=101383 RepID=A0A7K3WMD5_9FLAO|nr:type IX secretion system outer membrane channel protein PorV [Cryomorpha ignava]NEN22807.1 type IX secretion system outer membrane channel protein PorV [Cryomorpha ignava]